MRTIKTVICTVLLFSLGLYYLTRMTAANSDPSLPLPEVVVSGLALYSSGGLDPAYERWQQGGILESDRNGDQLRVLRAMAITMGNYKTYASLDTHEIGRFSRVVFLALNFERGVIFAKFHVYRTSKGWVVQSMDFNSKPEGIVP